MINFNKTKKECSISTIDKENSSTVIIKPEGIQLRISPGYNSLLTSLSASSMSDLNLK